MPVYIVLVVCPHQTFKESMETMRQPTGKGLPDIVTNVHDVILSFTAPTYS